VGCRRDRPLSGDLVYLGMALVVEWGRIFDKCEVCAAVYYADMYLVRMGRLSGSMRNEYQPKWWKPFIILKQLISP
jgi:hypothetical protein